MPDPTDPLKKVTRGTTTTTTSKRRGEIRKGIPGTFTDTTTNTPVTTTTTDQGGGSIPFQNAFREAKKKGLSMFTFGGNEYNTKTSDSNTNNETSTTSTFKADKVVGVPKVQAHGIKFSPQSYKMNKTQDIQRPGADAMHVISVGRGNPKNGETRDLYSVTANKNGTGYSMGKPIPQGDRVVTLDQKIQLQKNVDNYNSILTERFSPKNITANLEGQPQAVIDKAIAKGQDRVNKNKAFYKVPGKN